MVLKLRYMQFKTILAAFVLVCMGFVPVCSQIIPQQSHREVRAVWFTTIGGLDWPKGYASNAAGVERQKRQLRDHLDRLQAMGINTLLLQTRVRGTVIYPSAIEPWDGCLSGKPGVSPGYDALQYAVEQCHKRGMSIQAWVVAFPLTSLSVTKQLGKRSIISRHPRLCLKAGDHWMMNPGVPAVSDYLASLCAEIVKNYDVDGIHPDYIRYPEKEISFNDAATFKKYGKGMTRSEWRRENVTRCVRKIYAAIKTLKPWVMLSCSPVGKHDDLPRYFSCGWNARTAVAQDVQQWMKEGIMDEIFPMMYFKGNHFYPFALDWVECSNKRVVAPGLGVYFLDEGQKNWDLTTVTRELNFLRMHGADGQAYFRSRFLENNVKGIADYLQYLFYTRPALQPAMAWQDSIAPSVPEKIAVEKSKYAWRISWQPSTDPTPGDSLRYNVYVSDVYPVNCDSARLVASYISGNEYTLDVACPASRDMFYGVTAIDRFGNESGVAEINHPVFKAKLSEPGMKVRGGKLRLDSVDACFLMIHDDCGRELKVIKYDSMVDVSRLVPGFYKIYGQGRRGKPHLLGHFQIHP